jgi:hypothetical protein
MLEDAEEGVVVEFKNPRPKRIGVLYRLCRLVELDPPIDRWACEDGLYLGAAGPRALAFGRVFVGHKDNSNRPVREGLDLGAKSSKD